MEKVATPNIRIATWDHEPQIGALMALLFASDPFVRWVLPDPLNYLRHSSAHAGSSAAPAFDTGTAYVFDDLSGAVVWLAPNVKLSRDHENSAPKTDAGPEKPAEFSELIEKSAAFCPSEPHWYLAFIAVDPAKRGQGYGSVLMRHSLEIIDRDKLPTYLESTNAANLTIYERFGFEKLSEVRVGQSPARYPMLRPAQ